MKYDLACPDLENFSTNFKTIIKHELPQILIGIGYCEGYGWKKLNWSFLIWLTTVTHNKLIVGRQKKLTNTSTLPLDEKENKLFQILYILRQNATLCIIYTVTFETQKRLKTKTRKCSILSRKWQDANIVEQQRMETSGFAICLL